MCLVQEDKATLNSLSNVVIDDKATLNSVPSMAIDNKEHFD